MLKSRDFSAYYQALWSYDPFPWQLMLAERLSEGGWPKVLDLPTAAGKTASIDIALYALAAQADKPVWERTAPRRIWFVVDRRIVVDEAFDRAWTIAEKLHEAKSGPLKEVADRLRAISGTERPLAVARLRGGVLRDDGWARLPSQPAVITSTVDQLGSRLLFRGYGHSPRTAPIFAGLAAHDSLFLLDEAHLSVPFLQTLGAVQRYRGPEWAEEPIRTPFAFSMLSATPPSDVAATEVFPGAGRQEALDHPELHRRLNASKPAELVEVKPKRSNEADPLVVEAVARARDFAIERGLQRIAVVVNRVASAMAVDAALRDVLGDRAEVVLLTGRLRPLERDALLVRWTPVLRARQPDEPLQKPVVIVATQCIEVGADFSFDALVTEAASLDALRQRFGRLNRLGAVETAPAVILIRVEDAREGAEDPIYGTAVAACWALLQGLAEHRQNGKQERKLVDFGVTALDRRLEEVDALEPCLAPAPNAPMLLPAHLDLLCQTSPAPRVEPDIPLYLHGVDRGSPEVRVVWRADLAPDDEPRVWEETLALCPPNSLEALSVPLHRLRRWLRDARSPDDSGDVEGSYWEGEETEGKPRDRMRPALVWRGRERSHVAASPSELRPDDLVVLPAEYGMEGLGQSSPEESLGDRRLDIWEPSHSAAGKPTGVRLHRRVMKPWLRCAPFEALIELAEMDNWDDAALQSAIDAVLEYEPTVEDDPPAPPEWLKELLRKARAGKVEQHPAGGLILFAPRDKHRVEQEQDLFADDDDLLSATGQEVSLRVHSALVERAVTQLAGRCLPDDLHDALKAAAYWHDAGKLDERFQLLLRQGDELALYAGEPLAKSREIANSPARRRWLREASGLPRDFRHEMLSLQLAERYALLPEEDTRADLVLHCVASHHGHGRPFAPVSIDPDPPAVAGIHDGVDIKASREARQEWPAPHSLASGTAERFWRLTRRYGWWGLAYLEAILRLGDWYGSRWVVADEADRKPSAMGHTRTVRNPSRESGLVLTGIDGANPLGFLAAAGTLAVLHHAGRRESRLAWRRSGLAWRPHLTGLSTDDPTALSELLAEHLRGVSVSDDADEKRKVAERLFSGKKKEIKDKRDEIKKRGVRGKERTQALDEEVAPLERELEALRKAWLEALRRSVASPELALGKNIDCTESEYRAIVEPLIESAGPNDRAALDILGAFCSTGCLHESPLKRKDRKLAPTPFSFISGSGHQDFLDTAGMLLQSVSARRLKSALFAPWSYEDEGLSMRWDPVEDRRYALMDRDPTASDNKPRTVWMANLLAYRALALFPSAPRRYGLATSGWMKSEAGELLFTWPLWSHPIGPDSIRSLLLLPDLYHEMPDRTMLRARGVEVTFRARRIKVGSGSNFKVNFSPAREA